MKKSKTKREISAGGVVYKKTDGKYLWLIIQPKRDDDKKPINWRLPKGIIEKNETSEEAARREVEEEAGIRVETIEKIGRTTYFYTFKGEKIFKIIIFYLMRYLAEIGNGPDTVEAEKIEWLPYNEAHDKLSFDSEKTILTKAKKILERKESQQRLI